MVDLSITATKIANLRKEKGFTQEELATRLGVSSQAISKWERALSLPDIDLLIDISKILGVSIDFLLNKDIIVQNQNKQVDELASNDILHMIKTLKEADVCIYFGHNLVQIFEQSGCAFIEKIAQYRKNILYNERVLLPKVHIKDQLSLNENQCIIKIFGKKVWDKTFEIVSENITDEILENFNNCIYNNLHEFVNRHLVKLLVEGLRLEYPFVIDGVVPDRINLTTLKIILKALVKEKISLNFLMKIIEILDENIDKIKEIEQLIAIVKLNL